MTGFISFCFCLWKMFSSHKQKLAKILPVLLNSYIIHLNVPVNDSS